jgi:hypothetical protein
MGSRAILRYQARSMATSSIKRAGASTASTSSAASGGRPAVRRRPRQRHEDPTPVVSGRYNIALGFIAAMILIPFSPIGQWVEPRGPAPHDTATWTPGRTAQVRVTVVTGDYGLLTCAAEKQVESTHCAFATKQEAWPRSPKEPLDDNKANIIQPYRTTDQKLVLIAGLWANPVIAMRLHNEPAQGLARKQLRFVADCQIKFIGRLDEVKLRWNNQSDWTDEGATAVGRPVSCKIEPEDG